MTKTLRLIGMALMTVLMSVGFAACSSDDDNEESGGSNSGDGKVNISNVFTGGLPKSIDGMNMACNSDGTLASITDEDIKVLFEYGSGTRAVADDVVRMTVKAKEDGDTICYVIDMTLNASGFVKSCTETWTEEDGNNTETWEFGYNSDGQLNYMKRSEGNEVTNLTYQSGNIVKTTVASEEGDYKSEYSISYSTTENKGCIMLFDATLGIDMDEMEYAYYAGLLGKATKNLPSSVTEKDEEVWGTKRSV